MARFSHLVEEGALTEGEAALLNDLANIVNLEVGLGMNGLRMAVVDDVGITVEAVQKSGDQPGYDIYSYENDKKDRVGSVRTFDDAVDELRSRGR